MDHLNAPLLKFMLIKKMALLLSITLIYLATYFQESQGANILYVVPFTSKSHNIVLRPVGLELARRGHNVTVITAYEERNPPANFHQVIADNTTIWEAIESGRPNVFTTVDMSAEDFHDMILWRGGLASTEISLKSPQVQHFLRQDNKFDLVISEQFFQEALYTLAHKYTAPLALITTFGNCMRHNLIVGNPLQLATVIPEFIDVKRPFSFYARLKSLYFTAYEYLWWRFWYLERQQELVDKYIPGLPHPVPSLVELQRNFSLMLMNGHFSFDTPMAYAPNIVEVGGLHLNETHLELPQDLKKVMDEAAHGVVYMSFGSNVRSSELPPEKKATFLNVFRNLRQLVLWKWEDTQMVNQPSNVITRNWLPQQEILAHPNVKVFISHGGLIGMQEAIYHGVPVVGIPIYADQYNNLLQAQENGFGTILEYHDINESNLRAILGNILKDNAYRDKAREMSHRFQDRPLNALDTAVFWIEYVVRNKGAPYMKNPASRLSWMAFNMLDVYALALGSLCIVLFICVKVLCVVKSIVGKIRSKKETRFKKVN